MKLLAAIVLLSLTGCMSQGYRHCVGYMGATYCVDRPHVHNQSGEPVVPR